MKFIHEGWHWLEIDDNGNVIGSMTNAEHTAYMNQMVAEHAHNWFSQHGMPVDPSQWVDGVGHNLYGKLYNAVDTAINAHPDLSVEQAIKNTFTTIDRTWMSSLPDNPTPAQIYSPLLRAGFHEVADPFIQVGYEVASGLHHVTSLLLMVGGN